MVTALNSTHPTCRLRVLCIHGFRTNAKVMKSQMRALCRALGPNVEYVYLNAPFPAHGPPHEIVQQLHGKDAPFFEWWQSRYLSDNSVADKISDIIVSADDAWNLRFEDLKHSLQYMENELRRLGKFDLAIGFSQGATMLTIFSIWALKKSHKQWWRLAICVSGVRVSGANCRELFEMPDGQPRLVPIPSIHVAGAADAIYRESHELAKMYESRVQGSPLIRTVLEHDGAHRFPSPRKHADLYAKVARMVHQFFRYPDLAKQRAMARL